MAPLLQERPGIDKLFEGRTSTFINCINVDCESVHKESFTDLQLDLKGCKDVEASFDRYTEVEVLDGQNQYRAEGFGLQVGTALDKCDLRVVLQVAWGTAGS